MTDIPAHRYSPDQRAQWVAEIFARAADRSGHHAYAHALAEYWETAVPGDDLKEPSPEGITGVQFAVECALSSDFMAIYGPALRPGVHGGEYAREYIKLRDAARRAALRGAQERQRRKAAAEQEAAGSLNELLPPDAGE